MFSPDSTLTLPELILNVPPEVIAILELMLAVPEDMNVTFGSGASVFQEVTTFPLFVKLIVKLKSCVINAADGTRSTAVVGNGGNGADDNS